MTKAYLLCRYILLYILQSYRRYYIYITFPLVGTWSWLRFGFDQSQRLYPMYYICIVYTLLVYIYIYIHTYICIIQYTPCIRDLLLPPDCCARVRSFCVLPLPSRIRPDSRSNLRGDEGFNLQHLQENNIRFKFHRTL